MANVQETNLAWAVVEAVKPHLSVRDRSHVFVAVGAGDTFHAIRILLKLASLKGIPMPVELIQRCVSWLNGYGLGEDAQNLRQLVVGASTLDAANSTAALVGDASRTARH